MKKIMQFTSFININSIMNKNMIKYAHNEVCWYGCKILIVDKFLYTPN